MSVTVLVTGGNGFLGQHVIKLLNQKSDFVNKIKILDVEEFDRKLDYEVTKEMESIRGSVLDRSTVYRAVSGVQCVLHLAAVVDVSIFQNKQAMENVNVRGTELLIDACKEHNVQKIVYCSTMDVVIGFENIINGTEDLPKPKRFLFGAYAGTKHQAEKMVLSVNGTKLRNGMTLRTLSLRPTVMYGELDRLLVPEIIDSAEKAGGILVRFGDSDAYAQYTYVGNVAWSFLCALNTMKDNNEIGGEAFFISDDTPKSNLFDFSKFYIERYGNRLSPFLVPYWIIYVAIFILYILVKMLAPVYKMEPPVTISSVIYTNMKICFSSEKACALLSYFPIFNHPESVRCAVRYYDTLYKVKHNDCD